MSEKVACVIGAHPDDPEFAVGGTVALWGRQGWKFHYLIVTDGSKGTSDPLADPARLVARRQDEQRAAAAVLGVTDVRFLGFPDGEVQSSRDLLGKIVEELRRLRPQAVFTHNPASFEYRKPGAAPRISHRDHRVVGQAVLDAVYPAARDPLNFPEHARAGILAHKVAEVYLWGCERAELVVDVGATFDLKLEALSKHESQFPSGPDWLAQARERWAENGSYFEYLRLVKVPA